VLQAVGELAGAVEINPTPQEVPWNDPLDQDDEHASYDVEAVSSYFAAATQAALVLAAFRAPYRGRSTPVNAWWGSFDLAVNLFSGRPADPPADDYLMRNAMDAEEVAVGWWPGDPRYPRAAFYVYAHPARDGFAGAAMEPARWDAGLGEYVLDWDDVRSSPDPRAVALDFARRVFRHACATCHWDDALAASAGGTPPPLA
jgi:mono/diheme cytochrome c family protein